MKRLVFAPGICQIVNAAAALAQARAQEGGGGGHEDVLVLFGHGRFTAYAESMNEVAKRVWPWTQIIWAEDVLVSHFPTRRFAPIAKDILRERLGAPADQLWVTKLNMEATKLALHSYPESPVILFEDGAEEFIPKKVLCGISRLKLLPPSRWPGGLWREVGHWTHRPECLDQDGICVRDRRRVVALYSYLARFMAIPECLTGIPVVPVGNEVLLERLQLLAPLVDRASRRQAEQPTSEAVILYLSQPFADIALTSDDEYRLYQASVGDVLSKGYRILWKEHPRETTPLATRLQEEFGAERVRTAGQRQQVPVECLAAGWNLAGVVSVASSSLFYLKGLYGYATYTAAGSIELDRWRTETDAALARLFIRYVPGLDQLPPAGGQP